MLKCEDRHKPRLPVAGLAVLHIGLVADASKEGRATYPHPLHHIGITHPSEFQLL